MDGERYNDECDLETGRFGGGCVMRWAGIPTFHRTDLVVLHGGITGRMWMMSLC